MVDQIVAPAWAGETSCSIGQIVVRMQIIDDQSCAKWSAWEYSILQLILQHVQPGCLLVGEAAAVAACTTDTSWASTANQQQQ